MAVIHSDLRLHLQYRLWIAEMNADITLIRIFDDYFSEVGSKRADPEIIKTFSGYKQQFVSIRNDIDELKHEMHLVKMKLAANLRETNAEAYGNEAAENHSAFTKRYNAFREKFDNLKNEIVSFGEYN